MKKQDFNPKFSFSLEGGDTDDYTAPWEFKGALEQSIPTRGTTIDSKIKKQLSNPKQSRARRGPAAVVEEEEYEEEEELDQVRTIPNNTSRGAKNKHAVPERPPSSSSEEDQDDADEDDDADNTTTKSEKATKKRKRPTPSTKNGYFTAAPEGTTFVGTSFSDLNLSRPLVRACAALGYTQPTPIQAACIPLALSGRDICGSAITGSGKTAAFSLPLLERLMHRNRRVATTYALVLTPTRELAVQVHSMIQKLAEFTDIQAALVVGGLSLQAQSAALRAGPEIVVATPGRLIDHLHNSQGFGLEDLAALVLDEADRLMEMGFTDEVQEIVRLSPSKRQTLLFSATMTEEVNALITLSLRHPVRLAADAVAAAPSRLRQEVIRFKGELTGMHKEAVLLAVVSRSLLSTGRCIVFFSTKQRAHRAKILFGLAGLPPAAELHGDMTQAARLEGLERFRTGEAAFLLATDVAARGLDILGVETVINFDCPRDLSSYIHRVGRTARAGAKGLAITFVEDAHRMLIKEIVKKSGVELSQRVVPPQAVSSWYRKVEVMEEQVRKIYAEEGEEKELRRAEMEAQKASNMIEHEAEIYSRPPRTWFQSETQKKAASQHGKDTIVLDKKIEKKIEKNTAKSARRMERKIAAGKEQEESQRGRKNTLQSDTLTTRRLKALKASETAFREKGIPSGRAFKMATELLAPGGKKKKKGGGGKKTSELFGNEERDKPVSTGGRVYAGGARTQAARKSPKDLAKERTKKTKGGGFKSKSKHKRR